MSAVVPTREESVAGPQRKLAIIDTDMHVTFRATEPSFAEYLPSRWVDYIKMIGLRPPNAEMQRIMYSDAMRKDAVTPDGLPPGTNPEWSREQLLDAYDMTAAMINDGASLLFARGVDGIPTEMSIALDRAYNDWRSDTWLASDPRWYTAINVAYEHPAAAVAEIEHCRELSDRFNGVLFEQRGESPAGNPKYWPIFEAAAGHDIPVVFHVGQNRRMTGTGQPSYYFEDHTGFELRSFHIVSSLIFEGVFDRFPSLKVVLVEMGWAWAPPLAWRLDASWRVLREEVSHLERKPSEYMRDHFWFGTQPMEEPTNLEWFKDVYDQFEETIGDRLMFASDYPHWDFDSPTETLPETLPLETRAKILGGNASELYKIPLKPNSGIPAERSLA